MTDPTPPEELSRLETAIDRWLDVQRAENPVVLAVERDVDGPRRWFVRLGGDQKDVFTLRLRLDQRTLDYETHFMPAPEENAGQLYEHLLRRNAKLYGAAFAIGEEDAVYLRGRLDNAMVNDDELDRVVGTVYAWVEQCFRPAMRIGFASKFKG